MTEEVKTVTIPLWMFNDIISTMKYGADNSGSSVISAGIRVCIERVENLTKDQVKTKMKR